ncbi:DNA-binding protein [Salmonella enterica subsp. enterica]|nr:DNA-binding protein [Salmonella enterica subsp. enterica]
MPGPVHSVYGMRGCFSKNFTNEWRVAHGKSHSIGTQRHPNNRKSEGKTPGKYPDNRERVWTPSQKNSVLLMSGRLAGKKRLAILTGIFMIIQSGNLYLRLIGIYQHLKNIEKYKPLDWKLIKAMIWTETGAAVTAWKTRPIQIGNTGDEGIKEVVIPARPRKYNIIIPKTWNTYLINKTDLIRSNPEYNIRAGHCSFNDKNVRNRKR